MKKIVLSGFMASMLMLPVAALADGETTGSSTPLTTKNYVDDGLRAVYKASKTYTDSKIGDSTTGMTKDVNDLKAIVNGSGTNPGLDKIINGDGTNLGLNDIIKGDGTTANPGLINDVAALDTQINGTNGLADDIAALDTQINGNGTTTGLADDVDTLKNTIGDATTEGTLAYKVEQLQSSSTVYTAGNGINIDTTNDNTISVKAGEGLAVDSTTKNITIDGLANTKAEGNTTKMYVYKNGTLSEMPVQDTWDTSFDFDPND